MTLHSKRFRFPIALSVVGLSLGGLALFTFSTEGVHESDALFLESFQRDYRVYSVPLPSKIDFCGEPVPLYDLDVRERLDRELQVNTYWQSNTLLYHKRAHRWFPVIEPILKRHGIPDDFKYLAVIESGLMNSVSPSGAVGYWQILKATAQQYGLEVNDEVDERYHVEKSTEAACKYLREAYEKHGSWAMAAASYNMGMGGVSKQVKRQRGDSFYDLVLNQETSRYVFRIMAAKLIMEQPTKYGFYFREKDLYPPVPTYEVTIDGPVADFAEFADKHNTTYRILKLFNPWLREPSLANKDKKRYTVVLPKKGYFKLSGFDPALSADSAFLAPPAVEE